MSDGASSLPPEPDPIAAGHYRTDVAIIGAGVAGLYASLGLPEDLDVVVVDKGTPFRSGSSPWAQGGLAVALGPDDSPDLHLSDTIRAGAGLVDEAAAAMLAMEIPDRTAHLLDLGARFDAAVHGDSRTLDTLHLAREGGQTVARSVHAADATGAELIRVLREAATPRVSRLAGTVATLARDASGPVTGAWVVRPDGELVLLHARAVILATGGCGGLYAATTNQDGATADGVALAYLAGAAVRDLEFVQFHPTGLAVSGFWRFLLTEALRGAGATLHDDAGHRFMPEVHPDAELAPRHVVSRAILQQRNGRAWLDATGLGQELLEQEFPTVLAGARRHGFDLASEPVPVTPAAHYMVGGVRTDLAGRTSLPGLYAAGEVASTGLHGANRMAGNSLSEALVFGWRTAATVATELPERHGPTGAAPAPTAGRTDDHDDVRSRLRTAMWDACGPIRTGTQLAQLGHELSDLARCLGGQLDSGVVAPDPVTTELRLAVVAAELLRRSAWLRTETRGGHVRDDHPTERPEWDHVHQERIRPPR